MHKVLIYSTQTCTYCRVAKKFFAENNVEYKEFDVVDDPEKAVEMFEKSGQTGVPVIEIDGKIIVGFDRPAIKEALWHA